MQPWSLSPCLRLSQACRVKDPPLSLPFVLSGCFVRYDVRHRKTFLSFITSPNFLDFFAIILHDKVPVIVYSAVTKYWLYCCIFIFNLAAVKQHLGLIHDITTEPECRQYRSGQQEMQHVLEKPKLAFAQRGSKFAVVQSFKQLISSFLQQHKGQWCSKDSSPCLLMQRHFGQVSMFIRNRTNWRGICLFCVLREENWTHIFQRQRSRCLSIVGCEHHFSLVSSYLVMQTLTCPRMSTDPMQPGKQGI